MEFALQRTVIRIGAVSNSFKTKCWGWWACEALVRYTIEERIATSYITQSLTLAL